LNKQTQLPPKIIFRDVIPAKAGIQECWLLKGWLPECLDSRFRGNDNVTLKIYDILGREVATLVNERLSPGIYEVEWDASVYSSGVYFYKLIVSDASTPLSITRKMVLIK
jgi:hypothetical protein